MATWTTVPDSSLEPGKPIRSIDALALRDNPVAIAEGATGAPRILSTSFENLTAGNVIRSRDNTLYTSSTVANPGVPAANFQFIQSGTVRIYCELATNTTPHNALLRVNRIRAGVETTLTTFSASGTTFVSRTADVSVEMGDRIQLYISPTNSIITALVKNAQLRTNGEKWWPAVSAWVE